MLLQCLFSEVSLELGLASFPKPHQEVSSDCQNAEDKNKDII
jgi:hypothetical protein